MVKQIVNVGTIADDGTGDTLRTAGTKIMQNFDELYSRVGDSAFNVRFDSHGVEFTGDSYETNLRKINPSANRTITLPDASGTLLLDSASQIMLNKSLTEPKIAIGLRDLGGHELIKTDSDANAVNEITVANNSASNAPKISASGTDTNVNLQLDAKGTGAVNISKAAMQTSVIVAHNASIPVTRSFIVGNKSTANFDTTLADGTVDGEIKYFINIGSTSMKVTPTNFGQGTSFTLAQNDGCTLIWYNSNYYLVGNQGEITVTP